MATRRRSSRRGGSISTAEDEIVTTTVASPPLVQPPDPTEQSRLTPRNPIANGKIEKAAKVTPYETLRKLTNLLARPTTPLRRASSAGPTPTQQSNRRTPIAPNRTPGGYPRPGSNRRPAAATPHAQAAIREIELRRTAALTPGNHRRQSLRQQRETPRDILRALSRVLAPGTDVILSSPPLENAGGPSLATKGNHIDLDTGPELKRPRLSIPLGEDDDEDDSYLLPPVRTEVSMDDENLTQRSVEFPRRAVSEQPGRLSRGSFGSARTSDRFGDYDLGLGLPDIDRIDSSFVQQDVFDDSGAEDVDEEPTVLRDFAEELRYPFFNDEIGRNSAISGRMSDIRPDAVPGDDTETTFLLSIPQSDSLLARVSVSGSAEIYDEGISRRDDNEAEGELYDETESEQDSDLDLLEDHQRDRTAADISMNFRYNNDADQTSLHKGRRTKDTKTKKKHIKVSKYGIHYPSLPMGVVKRLAITFLRTSGNSKIKLSKDTLDAIMQASDWFFEQASEDLGMFSQHASRKTIDESDVLTLLKRQRQTNTATTPFALAQKYLPRELLQDLRIAPPPKLKRGRQLEMVEEDEAEDG